MQVQLLTIAKREFTANEVIVGLHEAVYLRLGEGSTLSRILIQRRLGIFAKLLLEVTHRQVYLKKFFHRLRPIHVSGQGSIPQ